MKADLDLEQSWPEVISGAIVDSGIDQDCPRRRPELWPDPFVRVYRDATLDSSLSGSFGVHKAKTPDPGNLQPVRYDPPEQEESQSIEWQPGMGPHPGSLY
jgi:hypothetical protein